MADLTAKAREFGRKYPTPKASPSSSTDLTWDQNCGIAMFQFGSFLGWLSMPGGDISSARRAASTSHIESKDYRTAPLGAYHWFDIGGWANGHVMQQVDRGTLVFGGTRAVWETVGVALGFMDVPTYLRERPAATYLGWSRDYSGGRPDLSSVADSAAPTPLPTPPAPPASPINAKDPHMSVLVARSALNGSCYLWNTATGVVQGIGDTYQLAILQKAFSTVEFAEDNQFAFIRNTYAKALLEPVAAAGPAPTTVQAVVDYDRIIQGVANELAKRAQS